MSATAPSQAARLTPVLILYGRAWCHLCEDMLAALTPLAAEYGAHIEVIDVDADPELEARYNELVPVLVYEGLELCHYRLDVARVRAALEPRPSAQSEQHYRAAAESDEKRTSE